MTFFNALLGGAGTALMGGRGGRSFNEGGYGNDGGANRYMNQVPRATGQYLNPFINRGEQAMSGVDPLYGHMLDSSNREINTPGMYDSLPNAWAGARDPWSDQYNMYEHEAPKQFGQMAGDPTAFLNNIQKNYTPSEGYKYRKGQLESQMASEAAAGGIRGTPYSEARRGEAMNGILGQDMQEYLNNILGIQGQGLSGMERMLAGRERLQDKRLQGAENFQARALGGAQRHQEFGLEGRFKENERRQARRDAILRSMIGSREQQGEQGRLAAHDMAQITGTNLGNQASLGMQQQQQQNQLRNDEQRMKFDRQRMLVDLASSLGGAAMYGMR